MKIAFQREVFVGNFKGFYCLHDQLEGLASGTGKLAVRHKANTPVTRKRQL